jgi:hypothetical protein
MPPVNTDDLRAICAAEGLLLLETLPPATGSVFLAKVRDANGRELLLKRSNGIRGHGEGRVAAAWAGLPNAPGSVSELDERTFLREWIDGEPLHSGALDIAGLLYKTGHALRGLHETAPLPGLGDLRERFSPEGILGEWSALLPAPMVERAARLASALRDYEPPHPALVHGDVVPGNILVTPLGTPTIIDPIGFIGMPARDIAQLAVALDGRDRRQNLRDIVAGYGTRLTLVGECFEWLTYMFLEKNLALEQATPASRTHFVAELTTLAESFPSG